MAAVKGGCTEIENIIGQGANVNSRHDIKDLGPEHSAIPEKERPKFLPQRRFERTPLHYAAEKGHFEAVQCLLRHGADYTMKSRGDTTPLHMAKGRCAGSIRSAGAVLLARDSTGSTPMHYMAASGDLDALRLVLSEASPDQTNKQQQTPLHLACEHGHAEVVHALLSARAYINAADANGLRPLHYAALRNHPDVITVPLAFSSSPYSTTTADVEAPAQDLWRPLHHAAHHGHTACATALLSSNADIEARTANGFRPLHLTVAAGHTPTVQLLLSRRADVHAATDALDSPLHLVLRPDSAHVKIATLLLRHGAPAAARLRDGTTPLMRACALRGGGAAHEVLGLVRTLLEHAAARAEIANACRGRVGVLQVACERAELAVDVVRVLLGAGARPRHQDFRALWRNGRMGAWEKAAVHAAMNEVVGAELRKDEVEWLIVAR